ncbi:MAG TPA: hypothetical protein VGK67_03410 [Myxococcales bacterium]
MVRKVAIAAVVLIAVAGLAGGGGYFARTRYVEKLEAEWSALTAAKSGDAERAAAFDRFLVAFPEKHLFGNPRAAEATRLAAEARAHQADEARRREEVERNRLAAAADAEAARLAEAEAQAKAAAAALPVREKVLAVLRARLFELLGDAEDLGRGSVFLHLEHQGVHEIAYGIVEAGPAPSHLGDRLLAPEAVDEALGQKVYDPAAKRVDRDALRVFLAAAYVAPDEPVLGLTAQTLYPAFRRRVRNELRLYRGLTEQLGAPLPELKAEFLKSHPGKPDVERDWREFYRFLFEKTDSLRAFGISGCELRDLDLGFWVRRIEDGTAPMLGGFLKKVVAAYDADWLAALGEKLQPFARTTGWVGADPVQLVKKGAAWVLEEGGGSVDPCARQFRADPPEKAPVTFDDARTGDRFVRKEALAAAWASEGGGDVAFTADSKQLVVAGYQQIHWVDVETLQEVRSAPLTPGTGPARRRVPKVVAGRSALVRPVQEGLTEIIDLKTGGVLAKFGGFVAAAYDGGATVMASLEPRKGEQPGRIEVRYRSGDTDWATTQIALPAETFEEVKVHPSGEVVFANQTSATGPAKTGFKAWDVGSGERRPDLDLPGVSRFSLSPGGSRLCRPDEGKGEVMLEWIDAAEGHRAPEPKKRWPGKDCLWLTNDRLLVQSEPGGIQSVLQVLDVATGKPVGRPIRIPSWDLKESFRDYSPDGRWLLLEDPKRKTMLFWSLAEPAPPAAGPVRRDAGGP